jgi:glycerol-3-phosphate dehydrogenase (NAD(P)+)
MNVAAVIGAGSWGTAFAIHLARAGLQTRLWVRDPEVLAAIRRERANDRFLPGCPLPPGLECHHDPRATVQGAAAVFVAVPSRFCRGLYRRLAPALADGQLVVSLTKGFDPRSGQRMSELMQSLLTRRAQPRLAVLSGPSFAREVALGRPTAVVAAAGDLRIARRLQALVATDRFRVYASTDLPGVETGGAVKNVIAIATGIADGLGLGPNARAALIARGLAETTRLAMALGGRRATLAGLAGVGDLVLTCTAEQSRNYRVGQALARGRVLTEILASSPAIAEGIETTRITRRLARVHGVGMPIVEAVHAVLYRGQRAESAVADLLGRPTGVE